MWRETLSQAESIQNEGAIARASEHPSKTVAAGVLEEAYHLCLESSKTQKQFPNFAWNSTTKL